MSRIVSIGTANPEHRHSQDDILGFMLEAHEGDAPTRSKINAIYKRSNIDTRYSMMPDYSQPEADRRFFPAGETELSLPGVSSRMKEFSSAAVPLSVKAIESCLSRSGTGREQVTHVIAVTCTGLSAPGLDLEIVKAMGLRNTIERTSLNFMGCYAAIHALKHADYICRADKKALVLVVCTELCTLHFQRLKEDDHLIANSLFADGSAAVLVAGEEHEAASRKGLSIKGFYSEIEREGEKDMAWNVSEKGFLMTLSTEVPRIIERSVAGLVERALRALSLEKKEIGHWAMHPGGKRIVEAISAKLQLTEEEQAPTWNVLRNYGNMSSAAILFVLQEIWNSTGWHNENIFCMALGPGLTMETLVLTAVNAC